MTDSQETKVASNQVVVILDSDDDLECGPMASMTKTVRTSLSNDGKGGKAMSPIHIPSSLSIGSQASSQQSQKIAGVSSQPLYVDQHCELLDELYDNTNAPEPFLDDIFGNDVIRDENKRQAPEPSRGDNDSDDSLPSMGDLLSSIGAGHASKKSRTVKGKGRATSSQISYDDSDVLTSSAMEVTDNWENDKTVALSIAATDKEIKAMERKRARETKEQQRKAKAEAKKQKERDKENERRVMEANRLTQDRSHLVKEMVFVVHDAEFMKTKQGVLLRTMLEKGDVSLRILASPPSAVHCTMTWQQKRMSLWDHSSQQFIPFQNQETRMMNVDSVLLFVTIDQLVVIIQEEAVDSWIDQQQAAAPGKQLFLMVEGLQKYYKKQLNMQRRQFTTRVLENMHSQNGNNDTPGSQPSQETSSRARSRSSRAAASEPTLVHHDIVEQVLAHLQMFKDIMVIETSSIEESVAGMMNLATDLARALYKNAMTSRQWPGPSATGVEPYHVWNLMLQEVQLCTSAMARTIADAYSTPLLLYHDYLDLQSEQEKGELLSELEIQGNRAHGRDRYVSKFMSKKVHQIMTSDDPEEVIS